MRTQSLTLQVLDKEIMLSSNFMFEISKYFIKLSLKRLSIS
jgi:hypothetical protein